MEYNVFCEKKPGGENSFQTILWFQCSEAAECESWQRRAPVPVPADAWLTRGASVAHVTVLVSYDPQEVEAERQQGRSQQVTQSCQVRDGKTVGIFATPPHGVHHPVCYTQQQQHLEEKERKITLLLFNMMVLQQARTGLLLSERMVTHLKLLII